MARPKKATSAPAKKAQKPPMTEAVTPPTPPTTPPVESLSFRSKAFFRKYPAWVYPTAAVTAIAAGGATEMQTSFLQSRAFHAIAEGRLFAQTRTTSPTVAPMAIGPYDERLGYTQSLHFRQRLTDRGYELRGETQWIQRSVLGIPLYEIYDSRSQGGLRITDDTDSTVYAASYPSRSFENYDAIPSVLVHSLLFVENRELMQDHVTTWNPAVEWIRTANAILGRVPGIRNLLGSQAGGSTLATQIEKFRHSEGGVTGSPLDKLRQMLTASVRAYEHGTDTRRAREEIVLDYFNSMPLAAYPQFGEVNGISDGMSLWFGADLDEANRLLRTPDVQLSEAELQQKAIFYRQALSLIMSVKKPTAYLRRNHEELNQRVNNYLPLLAEAGIISPAMRDRVLATPLVFTDPATHERLRPQPPSKPIQGLRIDLLNALGVHDLYTLNRLDVTARTTLDGAVNEAVTNRLNSLADPAIAAQHGLIGFRLLQPSMTDNVTYSFNLYERTPEGNVLRVQTDNYDGALNLNEGSKLELGSTAKLRTVATYLQIISEIHARYAGLPPAELAGVRQNDPLTRWTIAHLLTPGADTSLDGTMAAAMERRYSANTGERFFTGGGIHTFNNFDGEGGDYTVRQAFHNSVNLPFVRMLRDIVDYTEAEQMNVDPAVFTTADHPMRREYLARFARQEGELFLYRAWSNQRNVTPDGLAAHLAQRTNKTPRQLAVVYRSLHPNDSLSQMETFIRANCNNCGDGTNFESLYNDYARDRFNLHDRAYLTGLHPMAIWMAEQRIANPNITWQQALEGSTDLRVEIYGWLINSNNTAGQNNRIRTILEEEAFRLIHDRWEAMGFPFDRMVPSLASALGASGDTPAALAALAGIIQNDGIRQDAIRFRDITLGPNTPYELSFQRPAPEQHRVFAPAVADTLRGVMQGVVEQGTAVRARNSVTLSDGTILPLGGKTGTGDNRLQTFSASGAQLSNDARSRTATFVFVIDDRFYGTITAYVEGPEAANYRFTSSLASQIFRSIVGDIRPVLDRSYSVTPRIDPNAAPVVAPAAPATPPAPVPAAPETPIALAPRFNQPPVRVTIGETSVSLPPPPPAPQPAPSNDDTVLVPTGRDEDGAEESAQDTPPTDGPGTGNDTPEPAAPVAPAEPAPETQVSPPLAQTRPPNPGV